MPRSPAAVPRGAPDVSPSPEAGCGNCDDPYVYWYSVEGQSSPYTIPPPKRPNPNGMVPRRWPAAPGGGTQVHYEVNLHSLHQPLGPPAPPPAGSGCSTWPAPAGDDLLDAYLYWVAASAQSWNENPTSDIDLRLVQPQPTGGDPDQIFALYDATPGDGTADAVIGADLVWGPAANGPTGNGKNEVITVMSITVTSGLPVGGGVTSMLYDPDSGDILEVDIIITRAAATNLVTQGGVVGAPPQALLAHEFGHMLGLDHSDLTRQWGSGNAPPWSIGPNATDPSRTMPVPAGVSFTGPPVASDTAGARSNPGLMGFYRYVAPLQIPLWPDDAAGLASLYPIRGQLWSAPVTRADCTNPYSPIQATMHKTALINVSGRIEGNVERTSDGARLWGPHVVAIDAMGFALLPGTEQGPAIIGKLAGHDRLGPESVVGGFDEDSLAMTSGEYILDGLPAEVLPAPGPGWTFSSGPRDYHLVAEPLSWTLGHNPSSVHFGEQIVDVNVNPGVPPNKPYPAGFKSALNLLLDDYYTTSGTPDYVFNPVFLLSTAVYPPAGCTLQQASPFPALRIHPGSIIRVDLRVDASSYGSGLPGSRPAPLNANQLPTSPTRDRPNIRMVETASGSRIPALQSSYAVPSSFSIWVESNVDLVACGYSMSGTYTPATGQPTPMTFNPPTLPSTYPSNGLYSFTSTAPAGATLPLRARVTLTNGTVTVHNEIVW